MSVTFANMARQLVGQRFDPLKQYLKDRLETGIQSLSSFIFPKESAASISVTASTTAGAAGASLTESAGTGAAGAAGAAGGTGGALVARSGTGGAASSAQVAGASGAASFRSGTGGAGTAAQAAGASGAVTLGSGDAGANGGGGGAGTGNVSVDAGAPTGAGTAGDVTVGGANAETTILGRLTKALKLLGVTRLYNAAGAQYTTLTTQASAARAVAFPDAAGTVAVSATSPITLSAMGDIGASTAAVTTGGAGNAGKLVVLDGAGKIEGRQIGADGSVLDALAAGAASDVSLATKTIAAAAVATLNGTPVEVIAAPVAGKYIEIVSAHVWLDFGTTGYDGVAPGENLTLIYQGKAEDLITPITGAGFGDAVADAHRIAHGASDYAPYAATAVMATIKSGEWAAAAGDSPLKFEVLYRVRDLVW